MIKRSDGGDSSDEDRDIGENWGTVQNRKSGQLRDKMMNRGN